MQTVILCGGLGTRLREETNFRPKPMVPIGRYPILWHIMKCYATYGFTDFILALGYKGEIIKEFFLNYQSKIHDIRVKLNEPNSYEVLGNKHDENWRITLIETGQNTLKGGRLKRVEPYITNDNFMMTYGDGVSSVNISELLKYHLVHGKIATVTGVNAVGRFGELRIQGNQVLGFHEKPEKSREYINGGFMVFNKKVFDYLDTREDCDLESGPLEKLASDGEMMVWRHDGFWACMDTLRDVNYLNDIWENHAPEWKIW